METEELVTCVHCGQVILAGCEVEFDSEAYCPDCADTELVTCGHCGERGKRDNAIWCNDEAYCESCASDELVACNHCGEWMKLDDAINVQDDYLCDECADELTDECVQCGERFYIRNLRIYNGRLRLCKGCYEDHYFACDGCGEIFHRDDHGGDGYCQFCEAHNNEDDDGECSGLHGPDYRPPARFLKGENDTSRLFFGVELETECGDDSPRRYVDCLPGWVYPKSDGSLDNGMEIVSYPFTWKWSREHKDEWNEILALRKKGLRSYDTRTCGMHVHMSRDQFTALHLYKFVRLFYLNQDFIYKISRRRSVDAMRRWAGFGEETETTIAHKMKGGRPLGEGRYQAVNLENRHTVEIRVFRGTLSEDGFWRNLEFCRAAYLFTKDAGVSHTRVKYFVRWVQRHRKTYPHLAEFLNRTTEKKDVHSLVEA